MLRVYKNLKIILIGVLLISAAYFGIETYSFQQKRELLNQQKQNLFVLMAKKSKLVRDINNDMHTLQTLKTKISNIKQIMKHYGFPLYAADIESFISQSAVRYNLVLETVNISKQKSFWNAKINIHGKEKDTIEFINNLLSRFPLLLQDFELYRPRKDIFVKITIQIPIVRDIKVEDE